MEKVCSEVFTGSVRECDYFRVFNFGKIVCQNVLTITTHFSCWEIVLIENFYEMEPKIENAFYM